MYCKKITIYDINDVCNLYIDEDNLNFESDEYRTYIIKAKEIYKKMLSNGSYTLGCFSDNDEILGVININKILDYYPKYENNPYIHLETFIVKKDYQNKGVGTFLMTSAFELIKKEGATYVIIQSNNKFVQRICHKIGLKDTVIDMRCDFIK